MGLIVNISLRFANKANELGHIGHIITWVSMKNAWYVISNEEWVGPPHTGTTRS